MMENPAAVAAAAPVPGQPMAGGDAPTSEVIMVPDKMVGLIIGRGGEQITRLQAESGCKIQMAQDSAGLPDRQCTLTGLPASIEQAKANISRIVANEGNGPGGPRPGGGGGGGGPMGAGGGFFEMIVPGHKVGLIIGKGGEMIKQMQEQSGAKIVIIQDTPEAAMEKPLRITGPPESVEIAKGLVNDVLNQNDERDMGGFGGRGRGRGGMRGRGGFRGGRGGGRGGFGGGGWNGGAGGGGEYGGQATEYVQVPGNKCGLIIGKGGETIKHINQSTGAHCEVDKNAPAEAREKNFIIRGSPEAVRQAKDMILEKLGMGGSYGGGGGGYGGGSEWGGSGYQQGNSYNAVNVNPSTGQADYSAQWADYYRSMGMNREAEAIEAQRGQGGATAGPPQAQPAAAPNGAGAPANGSGADYSAQWADYYRSIGKHKEAEAIESQMKQKVRREKSKTIFRESVSFFLLLGRWCRINPWGSSRRPGLRRANSHGPVPRILRKL